MHPTIKELMAPTVAERRQRTREFSQLHRWLRGVSL